MLFQAQKEPIISAPSDEHSPSVEPPSEPEVLDPRQQTLLKFFRPTPGSSTSKQVDARHHNNSRSTSAFDTQSAQSHRIESEYDQSSSISGSSTPYSTGDMDVDINMDADSNTNYALGKQWTGSLSWT